MATSVVLAIEPFQCEGEQRQRILRTTWSDVGEQSVDQSVLDPVGLLPLRPLC
jgi:hypothetical protein